MRAVSSRFFCALALLSALAFSSVFAEDPPTSPPPGPGTTAPSPTGTPSWDDFERMLDDFERELTASSADSEALSARLKALQTEAANWKSSFEESEKRLAAFAASMREADRAAAALLEAQARQVRLWKWAAALGVGAGAAGLVYGLTR